MGSCDRFEKEFLSAWEEEGEVRNEHLRGCVACRTSKRSYERMVAALRVDDAPAQSADWQSRVLEATRARGAPTTLASVDGRPRSPGRQPRRGAQAYMFGASLALAAGIALLVVTRPLPSDLPDYTGAVEGGQSHMRGGDTARLYRAGDTVHVLLRPEHAVTGDVDARAFIIAGEQPIEIPVESSRPGKGVVLLEMRAPGGRGKSVSLAVVVARAERLGQSLQSIVTGPSDAGPGWRRLTLSIAVQPETEAPGAP